MNVSSDSANASETHTSNEPNGMVEVPRIAIARYDELRTFSTQWKKTTKGDHERKVRRKRPVLIVRRIIDGKGQLESTVVNIMSPALLEILTSFYGTRITTSVADPEASVKTLFHARHHFHKRLDEELNKISSDKELIFELEAMVNLIKEDCGSTESEVDQLILKGRITFDLLWCLFPPGCLVYRLHPQLNKSQVMQLQWSGYTEIRQLSHFSINCNVVSNDGNHFGLAQITDNIKKFGGSVRIMDLNFLPLLLHPNREEIYKHVVSRGSKFCQLEQQLFSINSGRAFQMGKKQRRYGEDGEEEQAAIFTANGRVMINSKSFRLFEPNSAVNLPVLQSLENRHNLTDDELSICSPVVVGFCFGSGFALEDLEPVTWSDIAFDSLVLASDKKRVIRALIQQHFKSERTFDDIISGKGRGLVGLLCGNPGCGKTLTAEAVAEAARLPLYIVGASDLGQTAREVDTHLLRIFQIATRWNAIVLIDEADVFLHRRTPLALEQNSLVAVFLRHLEYYEGVLIMTTNMNENFDPAFESRIHFSMHYPDLDHGSRKQIWRTFIRQLGDQASEFNEDQYNYLADCKLNGRQIKNTVSVARSLAADEEVPLAERHIKLVLESKAHWEKQFPTNTPEGRPTLFVKASILVSLLMVVLLYAWRVWGWR
ncbi:hypothetical protein H0H93_008710 [Arthromyces matolae]|nr:hypothetical protein H0H93_008710 [Arthromyces matolae]